jgi:hypothetical protein
MLRRVRGNLVPRAAGPEASAQLEREGWAVLRGVFSARRVATLRRELEALYEKPPVVRFPGRDLEDYSEFRHESLNHSAAAQAAVGSPRILEVIEPLLGEDCHVIANTTWRNPPLPPQDHGGDRWHIDAGPHVPRPDGVPWDDRIPYPVFAIGAHLLLRDCPRECGPTGVLARTHRTGRTPPRDRPSELGLTFEGHSPVALTGGAGDVALFVSDVWHRRLDPEPGDQGRFFLQVHYGRRDIAQRLRLTDDVNQLSDAAIDRARTRRRQTVIGLHHPGFYDG